MTAPGPNLFQVMSAQAQGVLEGEVNGPAYGEAGRPAAGSVSEPLVNGRIPAVQGGEDYGATVQAAGHEDETGVSASLGMPRSESAHHVHENTTRAQDNMRQQQSTSTQHGAPMPNTPVPVQPPQGQQQLHEVPPVHERQPSATQERGGMQQLDPGPGPREAPVESGVQVNRMGQGMPTRMITSPPEELPSPVDGARPSQAVWMLRLGEFFQRRVTQAAAVVGPVLERPQRSSVAVTTPAPPTSWTTPRAPVQEQPLFTPEDEQVMQQWTQRAPLLYGWGHQTGPQPPQPETSSSTGSLTKEQVLHEVHKQVQRAMQGHQMEIRALEEENKRLREQVERQAASSMGTTLQPDLRGGNPRAYPREEVPNEFHGQTSHGPPREPLMQEANVVADGEGPGNLRLPPGLGGQDGNDAGHRGPYNERGGDPGELRPRKEQPGGNSSGGQRNQGDVVNEAAGLEGGAAPQSVPPRQASAPDEGGGRGPRGPMDALVCWRKVLRNCRRR